MEKKYYEVVRIEGLGNKLNVIVSLILKSVLMK